MLKRIQCLFRGHKTLCSQVITLMPEGTADLDHTHECVKCGKARIFPVEQLDTEMVAMLQRLVGPQNVAVSMDTDPPNYIH